MAMYGTILSASQSSIGKNKASAAIKQDGMKYIIYVAEAIIFTFSLVVRPQFMRLTCKAVTHSGQVQKCRVEEHCHAAIRASS